VAALAGVVARSVGERNYLVQGLQQRSAQNAAAFVTPQGIAPEAAKLGLRAERTGQGSGCMIRLLHGAHLFFVLFTLLIMDYKAQTNIAQMGDFCLTHMS
jgi:hypothetical protein